MWMVEINSPCMWWIYSKSHVGSKVGAFVFPYHRWMAGKLQIILTGRFWLFLKFNFENLRRREIPRKWIEIHRKVSRSGLSFPGLWDDSLATFKLKSVSRMSCFSFVCQIKGGKSIMNLLHFSRVDFLIWHRQFAKVSHDDASDSTTPMRVLV